MRNLVTLKQLPQAARTRKVNSTSKFKHTHSYQTPPLALAYQHKQTHSYWSVWHYWGHFQFTDILMWRPTDTCQLGNLWCIRTMWEKITELDVFTHWKLFEFMCAQLNLSYIRCPVFLRLIISSFFFQAPDPIPIKKSKHEDFPSQSPLADKEKQHDWLQSLSSSNKVGVAKLRKATSGVSDAWCIRWDVM